MALNQQIEEYYKILATDPFSIPAWMYLQYKFMLPAMIISRNDAVENLMKKYGIKIPTICKP